jgi:hypothetical protein
MKDPAPQKVSKNAKHEGDGKTEEMTMKGISNVEKNKEEKYRTSHIAQKGDFVATTTTTLYSRVPFEN